MSKKILSISTLCLLLLSSNLNWCGNNTKKDSKKSNSNGANSVKSDSNSSGTTPHADGPITTFDNGEKFQKLLNQKSRPTVVAKFYAPWCGFCQKMAGPFEELAKKFDDLTFVKIDATAPDAKEAAQKYEVNGFPVFMIFKPGEDTAADKVIGADLGKLKTMIGKYSKYKPTLAETVSDLAEQVAIIDMRVGRLEQLLNQIMMEKQRKMQTKAAAQEAAAPVNKNITVITSQDQLDQLLKGNKPVAVDFHAEAWCSACKSIKEQFGTLADKYGSKVAFAKVDIDKNSAVASKYEIKSLPTFKFFKAGSDTAADSLIGADTKTLEDKIKVLAS